MLEQIWNLLLIALSLEPLHVATVILSNPIGRAFTIDSLNNSIDKALRSV